MKRLLRYIRQHLSLRLGLLIVLIVTVVFALLFDFLFYRCRRYVQRTALERATQLLDNTAERINGIMDETELVTNFMAATTPRHLHPDSLLVFSRRTVQENAFLTGFAISMEPDFFPEMGRYFSAYSLRHRMPANGTSDTDTDSITTVREGPFEYFEAVWYKTPRTLGTSCWVDAYDDYNEGTLSSPDILCSYCCPMRDADGHYIGSITASLTLKWLSQALTALKPYPHSSAIMMGRDGTYLVHPDTAKLFRETIFSDAAPEARRVIESMGRSMLAGHSGMTETLVDGQPAFILYRPVQRTGWSIAIVCPQRDVFARYYRLLFAVCLVIGIGLVLLMLFCYQTVRRAVQPLRQLDEQANRIAEGHFDESLPTSSRRDSVGRLQNSFIRMQQSLAQSVRDIRQANDELEQHNNELAAATQLKQDTNRRKAAFIQDMYHNIRTPLNIIGGFAQVLSASFHSLTDDEVDEITNHMHESAQAISRLTRQLEEAVSPDKTKQV
jgi:sigma-B regulation protein RsbU (phosphoserine phosphatase)